VFSDSTGSGAALTVVNSSPFMRAQKALIDGAKYSAQATNDQAQLHPLLFFGVAHL